MAFVLWFGSIVLVNALFGWKFGATYTVIISVLMLLASGSEPPRSGGPYIGN